MKRTKTKINCRIIVQADIFIILYTQQYKEPYHDRYKLDFRRYYRKIAVFNTFRAEKGKKNDGGGHV